MTETRSEWRDSIATPDWPQSEHNPEWLPDEPQAPPFLTPRLDLASLSIRGSDAESFLDGQFSAAIKSLAPGHWCLTAWHDPKGRARTLLHVQRKATGFECLMPIDLLGDILPKLKMYVLRSDVQIEDDSEHRLVLGYHGPKENRPEGFLPLAGAEDFAIASETVSQLADTWSQAPEQDMGRVGQNHWACWEIENGIPALGPQTTGLFLPQFLDLARFEGLNFKKGCYIGQEVIARTHYLGKVKQRLAMARCSAAPDAGSEVRDAQDRRIGHALRGAPEKDSQGQDGRWIVQLVIRQDRELAGAYLDQEGRPVLSDIKIPEQSD